MEIKIKDGILHVESDMGNVDSEMEIRIADLLELRNKANPEELRRTAIFVADFCHNSGQGRNKISRAEFIRNFKKEHADKSVRELEQIRIKVLENL